MTCEPKSISIILSIPFPYKSHMRDWENRLKCKRRTTSRLRILHPLYFTWDPPINDTSRFVFILSPSSPSLSVAPLTRRTVAQWHGRPERWLTDTAVAHALACPMWPLSLFATQHDCGSAAHTLMAEAAVTLPILWPRDVNDMMKGKGDWEKIVADPLHLRGWGEALRDREKNIEKRELRKGIQWNRFFHLIPLYNRF